MDTDEHSIISNEKLDEVDKVLNLVKGLSSNDHSISKVAFDEAGIYLEENKPRGDKNQTNNVDAFMAAVSQDAQERAIRRTKQRERANKIKDRANVFFKTGDWKRAIELYSQAIEIAKDWDILYTNRAQAYLHLGQSNLTLKDCDTALLFYPETVEAALEKCQSLVDTEKNAFLNRIAKIHLHRGKAFMSLNQPESALEAYSKSRLFSPSTKRDESGWPIYLSEYVVQAEAALVAQVEDAKAEVNFKESAIGNLEEDRGSASRQLLCLLAQLARANQTSSYYGAGLRQLTRLLANAPTKSMDTDDANDNDQSRTHINSQSTRGKKKKSNRKSKKSAQKPSSPTNRVGNGDQQPRNGNNGNDDPVDIINSSVQTESDPKCGTTTSGETLANLQTIFRVKNGFTLLDKEVVEIYKIFNLPDSHTPNSGPTLSNEQRSNGSPMESNGTGKPHPNLDAMDRILALLNLVDQLICNCAENQRILVESQFKLVRIVLDCMEFSKDFVQCLTTNNCETIDSDGNMNFDYDPKQRQFHIFGALRAIALSIMVSITSQPSGRQALLNHINAGLLLNGLAICLSNSLCSTSVSQNPLSGANKISKNLNPISNATSSICATRAAQILEYLVECPRFLTMVRSSSEGLEGLLSVIESALSSNSNGTSGNCLPNLLDSLATACQDSTLKRKLLEPKMGLLISLSNCLIQHAPLLDDPVHAYLISSACRLLYNISVGQLGGEPSTPNGYNQPSTSNSFYSLKSNVHLIDSILSGVGAILAQTGHGPELRAIAIALAGRLLPICSSKQLSQWFGEPDTEKREYVAVNDMPSRVHLLLAILDSCLPGSNFVKLKTAEQTNCNGFSDNLKSSESLTMHLVGGCIRCLAVGTKYSMGLRYEIGDDVRRVRRLVKFVRVRLSQSTQIPTDRKPLACSPAPPPPRDEPLAGNVCLLLQHCASDTPLAEHLQGTSVVYDLLSLIQESQHLDTKRNAAILIGKLARFSQVHRDELDRLDGFSVLGPFNSWS